MTDLQRLDRQAARHRRIAWRKAWRTFNYVLIREAMYTTGANPLTPERNLRFRAMLRDLYDGQVVAMWKSFVDVWPARRFRP